MIRDEPVNPHEEEVDVYNREHHEETHVPAPGEWLVIPLVRLGKRSAFWLSAALCVVSLILAIVTYSSPALAAGAPVPLAVAVVTGLIAAYYGSVLRDERRRA